MTSPHHLSPDDPPLIRAAQYVRMSTEHQQYSTENQGDVIRDYALARGYETVKRSADDGKSGLSIQGRAALNQRIEDVTAGKADFEAVLVYDVSRWSRFRTPTRAPTTSTPASAPASASSPMWTEQGVPTRPEGVHPN